MTDPHSLPSHHLTHRAPHSFPTRRSSDLLASHSASPCSRAAFDKAAPIFTPRRIKFSAMPVASRAGFALNLMRLRSEEHTSELQSRGHLVCRLLLEKKNKICDCTRASHLL